MEKDDANREPRAQERYAPPLNNISNMPTTIGKMPQQSNITAKSLRQPETGFAPYS
jgi:hypothetical protein